MRESGERGEGGTALVVDQDQGQVLRGVGGGQGQDEGAQQLALAGAGGTHAQPVRTDAQLGGLLEVQQHRLVAVGEADGNAQGVLARCEVPTAQQVDGGGVVDGEKGGESTGPDARVPSADRRSGARAPRLTSRMGFPTAGRSSCDASRPESLERPRDDTR